MGLLHRVIKVSFCLCKQNRENDFTYIHKFNERTHEELANRNLQLVLINVFYNLEYLYVKFRYKRREKVVTP